MDKLRKYLNKLLLVLMFNSLYIEIFADNLVDLYLLAKEHDPLVLQAKQNQMAYAESLSIVKAKILPQISLSGSKEYLKQTNNNNQNLIITSLNSNRINNLINNSYGININQSVFDMNNWIDHAKTKQQTLSMLKQYENTEQELLLRITKQYFAVLNAIDQLKTTIVTKKALLKRLEQAKQQFKVGLINITDLNEAQTRSDLANATEIIDHNSLNTEKEKLKQIVGKSIININRLKPNVTFKLPQPHNVNHWIEKAIKYNLKIQAARHELDAARKTISLSYANNLPTINFTGRLSKNKSSTTKIRTNNKQMAISFQIPIFNGGAIQSKTKAAVFQANAALEKLQALVEETESNTKIAYYTTITNLKYVSALKKRLQSSNVLLQATIAAFNVGTKTILDVLNAESGLFNAKKEYVQSKHQYILSQLQLKQASGTLCFADLKQINSLLENH